MSRANLSNANMSRANLSNANLSGVNLSDASLFRSDLSDANLSRTVGNIFNIKTLHCEKYPITYTEKVLQIGCERHSIEEWKNFDDEKINSMDSGALEWWVKWKPIIMQIIEMSPAEGTGVEE
jgi:uncharacterized protein YjbI with pentapeptide repeats